MITGKDIATGVTEEVAEWLLSKQRRCVECGSTYCLEIHHRISRGEGDTVLQRFLASVTEDFYQSYGRLLDYWHLHDVQNLVVLCNECHGLIDRDRLHRDKYRNSFTCPFTGFNVPFHQPQLASFACH